MIDAKSISEEQQTRIQTWADEGVGLSGIQRRLDDEFGVKATYMETRFLIDDLGIRMPEEEKPTSPAEETSNDIEEAPTDESAASENESPTPDLLSTDPAATEAGSVTVTISELQRPGAMANGTVTFAGGESADWYLDQFGRLGLDPKNPEFRPSESEMMAFQKELQNVAKDKGF